MGGDEMGKGRLTLDERLESRKRQIIRHRELLASKYSGWSDADRTEYDDLGEEHALACAILKVRKGLAKTASAK